VAPAVRPLYDYLANRGALCRSTTSVRAVFHLQSRRLRRIAGGDAAWEDMVPAGAAELIKKRGFFGYVRAAD